MSRLGPNKNEYLVKQSVLFGNWFGESLRHSGEDMPDVSNKVLGHLVNRHNVVRQAGGEGASGHPVILGRFRVLYYDHTALALDRPQPQGPLGSGSRKHYTNTLLFLVLGQRAEKGINRCPMTGTNRRFHEVELAVKNSQVPIGRNNVNVVGFHPHAVLDLCHLHARVMSDQIGQNAFVVRVQMLNHDKGHAAVRGHRLEELFECFQSTSRCADAYDGE